ncbi:hypothetical protein FDECE_716 [Fusarium decemcellulare]|nr:hypothetical protein FDECE_716 [Fusarium decemcellulare]
METLGQVATRGTGVAINVSQLTELLVKMLRQRQGWRVELLGQHDEAKAKVQSLEAIIIDKEMPLHVLQQELNEADSLLRSSSTRRLSGNGVLTNFTKT